MFVTEMGMGEDSIKPIHNDSLPNRPNFDPLKTRFSRGQRAHAPHLKVNHVESNHLVLNQMMSLKYNRSLSSDYSKTTERMVSPFRNRFVGSIKTVNVKKHFNTILRPMTDEHRDPVTELRGRHSSIRVVRPKIMIQSLI